MEVQLTKLYSILKNDATLASLLGGTATDSRIYPVLNKQLEVFPCITYLEIDEGFNTVPRRTLNIVVNLSIYSKTSKGFVESVANRVNELLNYYKDTDDTIIYIKQVGGGADLPEPDRQLYRKLLRFRIWGKQPAPTI